MECPRHFFADELALVYDVGTAYKPSPKGGWAVKRQQEAAAAAALSGIGSNGTEVDE